MLNIPFSWGSQLGSYPTRIIVPRETSNLSEERFGDVAVLKQISVLHHKNS
jgi:hypothetical protein